MQTVQSRQRSGSLLPPIALCGGALIPLCFIVTLVGVTSAPSPVDAHVGPPGHAHPFAPYSRRGENCGRRSDPVTVVYRGTGARMDRVTMDIGKHIPSWDNPDGVRPFFRGRQSMYVISNLGGGRYCAYNGDGRASRPYGEGPGHNQYHVRLWQLPHITPQGRYSVAGTPHHEQWVESCGIFGGHAVYKNGFDRARRRLVSRTRSTGHDHEINRVKWGNTETRRQECTGVESGSNGIVAFIRIGR